MMHELASSHSGLSSLPGGALRIVVVDSGSLLVEGATGGDGVSIDVGATFEDEHAARHAAIATHGSSHFLIESWTISNASSVPTRATFDGRVPRSIPSTDRLNSHSA